MSETDLQREEHLRKELIGKVSPDTYGKNYLIEAGAGAGKTFVMVNRIVNQLLDGHILPENLAAITFTEKATQEMLQRIDTEIIERLQRSVVENGPDAPESLRLRRLMDSIDQMQISTIHAFCRKLLMTMPYESALGPEFDVIEDSAALAEAFFEQKIHEDPSIFDHAREITGIRIGDLKHNFILLCESGAEIISHECTEQAVGSAQARQKAEARQLHALVAAHGDIGNYKSKKKENIDKALPKFKEILRLAGQGEEIFADEVCRVLNPCTQDPAFASDDILRLMPKKSKNNTLKADADECIQHIREEWKNLIHMVCMSAIKDLIADYRTYKKQNRTASQNDLLIYTRDMLRESPEARRYFHSRYQTVYVDEMQDTDPVQAQILFYLTTEEKSFNKDDWKQCRPVPGSLFLVGDPKQAIYRFRGADISVYKILTDLFESGVGEVKRLHFNYRSCTEICDFADHVFGDVLDGGGYQAEYSPMTAVHGSSVRSRLITYKEDKDHDACHVAAFIAEMTRAGTIVGISGNEHAARYDDFMILTRTNDATERYVRALSEYGIPCNMSGSKKFSEVDPVRRAEFMLGTMLDREDETKLALALVNCYGVSLKTLREYRQRVRNLTADHMAVKKAMMQEGSINREFETIFSALDEIDSLCGEINAVPAMTVIEDVFFKSVGIWTDPEPADRGSDYAMVCQYLKKLRDTGFTSFPSLAAQAVALVSDKTERELLLDEKENCVRIMNLHKAKGLEAEIIILAYDSRFKAAATKHTVYEGNSRKLHACLTRNSGYGENVLAWSPEWASNGGPSDVETVFLSAEIDRLMYVAATRAKTALIVNMYDNGCAWYGLGKAVKAYGAMTEDTSDELEDEACNESDGEDSGLYRDRDPLWQLSVRALDSGECTLPPAGPEDPDAGKIITVSVSELERGLRLSAESASFQSELNVTPSMLERKQKKQLYRDDVQAEAAEDASEGRNDIPHGADWGTIIHRILELMVRNSSYDPAGRKKFAAQAVTEVLGDREISAKTGKQLLGNHVLSDSETLKSYAAGQAAGCVAFLNEEHHPLRELIRGKDCFTELPFILQETDLRSPLAAAVSDFYGGSNDKPINVNGVIDLALRDGDCWTVVDYKTDAIYTAEPEIAYINRLKTQYALQLKVYREVINRLGKGTVMHTYICSIPLGGKLIEV